MAETGKFQHEWEEYLRRVDSLTAVQQRIIAAILGALVADAAGWYLNFYCMLFEILYRFL